MPLFKQPSLVKLVIGASLRCILAVLILLKLFINGNGICHTIDAPSAQGALLNIKHPTMYDLR